MHRPRTRAIRVSSEIYERLEKKARRRGMSVDALATELLTTGLARLDAPVPAKPVLLSAPAVTLDASPRNILRASAGLPGCFASGDTLAELFESLQEGATLYLATA